ncbi:DUF4097 family beta strand repeat-containing protein [Jeotgalibacillus sp. R-1-5s-1]|uniref:DUF4097 family beta strand repeat-containing protein n=1 Tax=Jeotgalibacillus sp. R-1-5s-1 TaxID=2555897 RepID=UPI00141AD970|nr:DUF4097 family beta strand repeat-containing protein [Jeotgalibacillus sp. R-1-5s-1]
MENERKRILSMVEKGTITASEALTLLEALEKEPKKESSSSYSTQEESKTSSQTHQQSGSSYSERHQEQKRSKKTDFPFNFEELFGGSKTGGSKSSAEKTKKSVNQSTEKLMDFMQTAFDKVKGMDLEFNMGPSLEFKHVFESENTELLDIEVSIANGKVTIRPWDEDFVRAECDVKVYRSEDQQKAVNQLKEQVVFETKFKKLRYLSDLKMIKLDTVLYVPKANYDRWDIRLFNGKFHGDGGNVNKVKVKTANGKIELSNMLVEKAELETANGGIEVTNARADYIDVDSVNGKVILEGAIDAVDAQSVNGKITVTTTSTTARKIDASTLAGAIEITVPDELSLDGTLKSNFGKFHVDFNDMDHVEEREEMMQRKLHFTRNREHASKLLLEADAKTGTISIHSSKGKSETKSDV